MLFFSISTYSHQIEKLELKSTGIEPAIITLDSTYTSTIIYKRIKEWIQTYYKNPAEVLKADMENKNIRIDGYNENGMMHKSLGVNTPIGIEYSLDIDIKDGRYRLTFSINRMVCGYSDCLYTTASFFKKDGSINEKWYGTDVLTINNSMNQVSLSLYKYIIGETTKKKSDW